jgi:uncharacterized coiled-coil DUF342 family protein
MWSWAIGLALGAAWFIAQPYLTTIVSDEWRLPIAGILLTVASVTGIIVAVLRAPPRVVAALLFDERFGLKERVTTSLTLAPEQAGTPAAHALLEDVNQRVSHLNVGTGFPVRVSWLTTLAPVCAAVLAAAAFFYQPSPSAATTGTNDSSQPPKNAAEIEQKLSQLKKKLQERPKSDRPLSQELREIDAKLDEIANRPRATKEQLRDRIKEMTALEDQLQNREKEWADKVRSLKQQLRQIDQTSSHTGNQEGPGKDLQKALAEGKLEKARDELQKLTKKLKNNDLSETDKKQLAKQLKDLQNQLERAADQKDKKEQLKKLHEEGRLDADALRRELKQLEEDAQKLKDLQKLANQLGQCQQALQKGNNSEAARGLEDAADQLKELDLQEGDLQDLRDQLQRLRDAKDSC